LKKNQNRKAIEIYEQSRYRNDNNNISASPSLDWTRRIVGNGSLASAHGSAKQESKTRPVRNIAFTGYGLPVLFFCHLV
jgi:hypothetical protein